jgi:glycogen synthase
LTILVISNLFPPRVLGGYEILCGQVCAELQQRGHRVVVATTASGPDLPGEPPVGDVRRVLALIQEFGTEPKRDRRRDRRVWKANRQATLDLARELEPDVAFVFSQLRLTLGPALGLQDAGVPTLFTVNDEHLTAFLPGPFEGARGLVRRVLDGLVFRGLWLPSLRLSHVTCISRRVRDNLVDRGVPVDHARVIHQGIPVPRFPVKDDPGSIHDPLRVLYAGQLHPDKGVHTLVEAVGRLAAGGLPVRLTVAGQGPGDYPDRLALLASTCGAPTDFLGRLPHDELPALYRDHDAFVFPSIWQEPFGLTHLEAMASGTPVVSTADGGQGEFLEHEVNALVFPKSDVTALVGALARLAADGALRARLAATARRMVEQRFSMTRYVDDLQALLSEVAGGGG